MMGVQKRVEKHNSYSEWLEMCKNGKQKNVGKNGAKKNTDASDNLES